jgi:hypothetical protein
MVRLPHRIRRQRWLVRVPSQGQAFHWRERIRDNWQDKLLPVLQETFDHYSRDDRVIRISKIELRLRIENEEMLEHRFIQQVNEALDERLQVMLEADESAQLIYRAATRTESSSQSEPEIALSEISLEQQYFQILVHYLRTGTLRWEASGGLNVESATELASACRQNLPELARILRAEQSASLPFCFRLLRLIASSEIGILVPAIVGESSVSWHDLPLQILSTLLAPEQKYFDRYSQLYLAATLLKETISARGQLRPPDFVDLARRALPFAESEVNDFFASLKIGADGSAGARGPRTGRSPSTAPYGFNSVLPGADSLPLFGAEANESSVSSPVALSPKDYNIEGTGLLQVTNERRKLGRVSTLADAFQSKLTAPLAARDSDDALPDWAKHAGLVLVHPFLAQFLESSGVIEKNSPNLLVQRLPRAAALLHFLASGETSIYEYDLLFMKVLLGLDPKTPLCIAEGLISEGDRDETDTLLRATLRHWAALKETSISGLRNSFLQRPGLLRSDDNGWRLQIERAPFDVLLDRLPWSINVVKLPWMKQPLYTEW